MVVPFAALWAALLPAAGTPTGASRPAELSYGFLNVPFPPARALNASTPCLLTSTGPFPRICCDQDPLGSTPSFEPEITTSPVASAPDSPSFRGAQTLLDAPLTWNLDSSRPGLKANLWPCTPPTFGPSLDPLRPMGHLLSATDDVGTQISARLIAPDSPESLVFNPHWHKDDLYLTLGARGPAASSPTFEPLHFTNTGSWPTSRHLPLSTWRSPSCVIPSSGCGQPHQPTRAPVWNFGRLTFEFNLQAMLHRGFKDPPLTRSQRRALGSRRQ